MAHGFTMHGGLGAGGSAILHESSDHSVLVPDTELLFTAQFHRAGPDLVLTGRDGAHHLVPGYFSSEHHPALVAPNGAHLSPDTVDLLAGSATPGHYAQAQPTTPPDAIGKIEKVVGDVSVVRNGVTVALHVGDAVFKSDVVQTGASSACGISFPDGTALNLVANTRMALNDYAYDANSNSNGALFSLVEGTFAFVAGKVAHSGDMKIATPVATMGIRGTTGVVQEQPNAPATITATAGDHTYSFAVVPDIGTGITGMWDVYLTDAYGIIQRDANGNPIVLVTVSQSGYVTYVTPQGVGQAPLVTTEPVTNSQYAFEQQMLADLFRTLNPSNLNNNNNGGSSTQPPPFNLPNPIPQLFEDTGKPFTINFTNGSNTPTPPIIDIVVGTGPLTVVIWTAGGSGPWSSGPSWLGGAPPTSPQEVEILNPVKVTTDGADSAAGLVVAGGATLNIVSGTSFTIYDFIHGAGTIAINSSGSDPTLFIHGPVSLAGGGTIKMLGPAGEDNILGVAGTGALLINVDYTIQGTGTIGGGDGLLTFENFGIVNANNGLLTINTGNQVYNDGLMEATVDPLAATVGTLWIQDSVVNAGTVQADGGLAIVELFGATFDNLFSVVAKNLGSISFFNVAVTNEAISATNPFGGTISAAGGFITFYGGSIANNNVMEATDGGLLRLENIIVTNSSAAELTIGATAVLSLESAAVLGGTIENAGNVTVSGLSQLNGDTVTNSGAITVFTGGNLTLEGTTLTNAAGATISADDGGSVDIEINNANTTNDGTIESAGGKVTINVNADGSRNDGTIEADSGIVIINSNGGGGGGGGGGGVDAGGNYGTITALNVGTVSINGGITNHAGATIDATASSTVYFSDGETDNLGTIEADGTGARVIFADGMLNNANRIVAENDGAISLGSVLLDNKSGGLFEATAGGTIDYDIGGVTNDGIIEADNNGAITFEGQIGITNDAAGIIEALSGGSIVFKAGTTGSVSNDGHILASGNRSTITFDSTLNGAQNTGTIEAAASGTVIIDGFVHNNALFNTGAIEATAGGTVIFDSANVVNYDFVTNVMGTISADGAGATVRLIDSTIAGGVIQSTGGGIIETPHGTSTLNGVTIGDGTLLKTDASGTLQLENDISLIGTVTFEGGGVFVMNDGVLASAIGATSTLVNTSTITGWGTIGNVATTLENQGVINANLSGQFIGINTADNDIANNGTMEATNGGYLQLDSSVDNTDGLIAASSSGTVYLETITITHGNLKTDTGGLIDIDGGNSTFDSLTIEAGSQVRLQFGASLTLEGSIENDGTVTVTGVDRDVVIAGAVSLTGSGAIVLAGSGEAIIGRLGGGNTLDNASTIEGAGQIGGPSVVLNNLVLDNEVGGVVDANINDSTLTIHTGNTVTNAGTLEATNGGTLQVDDAVTNSNVIAAHDSGSAIILAAGGSNSGAITATGGGSITIDNANNSSVFNSNLIQAGDGGTITIDNTSNSGIWNSGTLEALTGGTLNIYDLDDNIKNTGTFEADGGTINITHDHTSITNLNLVEAIDGGTINITNINNVSGGGNAGMEKADGGTINVHGGAGNSSGGTTEAIHCGTFDVLDGGLNNASGGTVKAASGGIFDINGGLSNASGGTVEALAGGTVNVSGTANYTNFGTIKADAGHVTLALTGNGSVSNTGSGATIEALDCGTVDITINHAGNNSGGGVANSGTMEADDGTLNITLNISGCHDSVGIVNSGIIEAIDGGTVNINIDNTGTNNATGMSNSATAEALSGGTLNINSGVGNSGTITADDGTVAITTYLTNSSGGTVVAQDQGTVTISCAQVTTETGSLIGATGAGSTVTIDHSTIDNAGGIGAENGGAVTIENSTLDNSGDGDANGIGTTSGGTITIDCSHVVNCGSIGSSDNGTITIEYSDVCNNGEIGADTGGTLTFEHSHVVNNNHIGTGDNLGPSAGPIGTVVFDHSCVVNNGSFESGHNGEIDIDCSTIDNTNGTIQSGGPDGGNSSVQLSNATIIGGTLATLTGGIIEAVCGTSTLDGVTIDDGSIIKADAGTFLDLEDTTTLNGTVTFEGCGTFDLSGKGAAIVGSGDDADLHNYATIAGAGTIGNAELSVTNECSGVIDATGCLTIDLGLNELTNHGLLEATGGGELTLLSTVSNSNIIAAYAGSTVNLEGFIGNSDCGQVIASGHCAVVDLFNATINGGTVESDSGGLIQTVAGDLATQSIFDDVTIGCGSDVKVVDQTTLVLEGGTTMSGGTLSIESSGGVEIVNGGGSGGATLTNVTLYNCGEVTVDNDTTLTLSGTTVHGGAIDGTDASGCIVASTIDVTGDSTFCGVHLSGGDLTVESNVTLTLSGDKVSDVAITGTDASGCIVASTIDVTGDSTFCNASLSGGNLTVEGGVTLTLSGGSIIGTTIDDYSTDPSGCIVAGTIDITADTVINNSSINNGILTVEGGVTLSASRDVISGTTINDYSTDNSGTIIGGNIDITGDSTFIDVALNNGNLTVDGGMTLTLSGATINGTYIDDYTDVSGSAVGATIVVTGNSAINNATVDGEGGPADSGTPGAITVDCNVALTLDNTMLEDLHLTNHGALHIAGASDVTTLDDVSVTNSGCIEVDVTHSGAILTLDDDTSIGGGTLTINSPGALDIATGNDGPGHGATLDHVTVTDNGNIDVDVTNSGAILTLDDGSTISGCGAMTIETGGTLDVNGGTTTINLVGTITNDGTIEASCGGTLDIVSHVDNSSGALEATSGGKLDIESAICGGTATIHGATLEFDASSNVHVTFDNGSVDSPTYGTLVLGDPEDFHGIISDFIGTCADSAHSDVIDLQGIDYNSHCFNECYNSSTGVLTVTDGLHTAYLNFDDFAGTFKFASDNNGGTDVYDPPVGGAKDAPATASGIL